jgi:hypothetical protein
MDWWVIRGSSFYYLVGFPNGSFSSWIESIKPLNYKHVYGRVDGMPNSLESMVVCDCSLSMAQYKG